MMVAAESLPIKIPRCVCIAANATGTVFVFAPVKISANKNSFQARIKLSTAADIIPGAAIGKIIRKKAPIGVAPSIKAASSNDRGMLAKKPISIQTKNGKLKAR